MRARTPLPPFQPIPVTVPFRAGRLLSAAVALAGTTTALVLLSPLG